MEAFTEDSIVLELTLYCLCPGNPDEGWDDDRIVERVALFNAPQRTVVGEFLRSILNERAMRNLHRYAEHGLKFWCA